MLTCRYKFDVLCVTMFKKYKKQPNKKPTQNIKTHPQPLINQIFWESLTAAETEHHYCSYLSSIKGQKEFQQKYRFFFFSFNIITTSFIVEIWIRSSKRLCWQNSFHWKALPSFHKAMFCCKRVPSPANVNTHVLRAQGEYFDQSHVALPNVSKFFLHQALEERKAAEALMKYQQERGGHYCAKTIQVGSS